MECERPCSEKIREVRLEEESKLILECRILLLQQHGKCQSQQKRLRCGLQN